MHGAREITLNRLLLLRIVTVVQFMHVLKKPMLKKRADTLIYMNEKRDEAG